jgi:signal peptidase I
MLPKLYSIRSSVWSILILLTILAVVSAFARSTGFISSNIFMYGLQPAAALVIAGIAYFYARDTRPIARTESGRVLVVGSVLSVWLVLYFLSGLIITYVHNSLFTGAKGLGINLWQFGVTAAAIEYSRYSLIKLAGKRNMLWFGFVLSCVLAVLLMDFTQLHQVRNAADFIKLCISNFMPAVCTSFILTYLAITCGLKAQLIYRLTLVAIIVFPPIIPKPDWYLQGISLMMLAVITFVAVDRETQADVRYPYRQRNHRRVFDGLWISGMLALACFMIGVFNYRPYAIPTNSMVPTYRSGALVIVEKIHNPMDVKVGDIVQYKSTSKLVTHRVVAIDTAAEGSGERVFTVKGDNNPSADNPVRQDQIMGVVRAHVPYAGYPTVWLMELTRGGR